MPRAGGLARRPRCPVRLRVAAPACGAQRAPSQRAGPARVQREACYPAALGTTLQRAVPGWRAAAGDTSSRPPQRGYLAKRPPKDGGCSDRLRHSGRAARARTGPPARLKKPLSAATSPRRAASASAGGMAASVAGLASRPRMKACGSVRLPSALRGGIAGPCAACAGAAPGAAGRARRSEMRSPSRTPDAAKLRLRRRRRGWVAPAQQSPCSCLRQAAGDSGGCARTRLPARCRCAAGAAARSPRPSPPPGWLSACPRCPSRPPARAAL